MYNNPYMMNYNPNISQIGLNERIDNEIAKLQQMKEQMKNNNNQQPAINQTFQLAPTSRDVIRYATSLEEVQRDMVIGDTPYFSKDMSVVWIKNIKGDIKTYELNEIIPKDEKDILINSLQMQIEELRKEIKSNEKSNDEDVDDTDKNEKPSNVSIFRTSSKKSK